MLIVIGLFWMLVTITVCVAVLWFSCFDVGCFYCLLVIGLVLVGVGGWFVIVLSLRYISFVCAFD